MVRGNMKINIKAFDEKNKELKRHKIVDGANTYRILPPFGEEADGYPYKRWSIVWLTDLESGKRRPYATPWSFQEKKCPVDEYCSALLEKIKSAEAKLTTADVSKEQIAEKLKPITELVYGLTSIKPKSTFFYNAINKAGEVGVLELKKSAHDQVKKLMKEYVHDYNQDPTSLNSDQEDSGVWFKIIRSGLSKNTEYTVEKSQIKFKDPTTGRTSFQDDQSPLPENVVENFSSLATNLFSLYRRNSYEDLKEILLANLAMIYKSHVEKYGSSAAESIKIQGFEFEDFLSDRPEPKANLLPKETIPMKSSKPKVMPRLDDEDDIEDEDEEYKPQPKQSQVKQVQVKSKADSSLFDMADDILS
jgi:hypothetical protein